MATDLQSDNLNILSMVRDQLECLDQPCSDQGGMRITPHCTAVNVMIFIKCFAPVISQIRKYTVSSSTQPTEKHYLDRSHYFETTKPLCILYFYDLYITY
jgi:hypothetical protein